MGNPEARHEEDEIPSEQQSAHHKLDHYETMKPVVEINELPKFLASKEGQLFLRGVNKKQSCIDGRVDPEGAQCSAGSGIIAEREPEVAKMLKEKESMFKEGKLERTEYLEILASAMPAKSLIENEAKMIENGELDEITCHPGCGAAGKYLSDHGIKDATQAEVDEVAKKFVLNKIAQLKGMTGMDIKFSESKAEGHHQEVATYVDSTKRLDLIVDDADKQLPNGFLVSSGLANNDVGEIAKQVGVSLSIAFGSHGIGLKKFLENPLYPIILIDSKENPLPSGLEDKIKADANGFIESMRKELAKKGDKTQIPDNLIKVVTVHVKIPKE